MAETAQAVYCKHYINTIWKAIIMYSFITKTSYGFILTIRDNSDLSAGRDLSINKYNDKKSAKQAAIMAGAKAWNY